MDRITAIRKSLTAFACGLIGLVPVIGLVPAAYAVWCSIQVRSKYRDEWNPASAYLKCGAVLGRLALSCTIVVLALFLMALFTGNLD